MAEITLESLAERVAALEKRLQSQPPQRDWRSVVGIFEGSEFAESMIHEALAIREAERKAVNEGNE